MRIMPLVFNLSMAGTVAAAMLSSSAVRVDAQVPTPPTFRPGPELKGVHDASVLEGEKVYLIRGCNICHGRSMRVRSGPRGPADLAHSALVAADVDGNLIGAIVRKGIPTAQHPMTAFPDISDHDVKNLAAYIHYVQQSIQSGERLSPSGH